MLGAVLAGGASRRMGTDKALLPVGGQPMASQVAAMLRSAGASTVVLVGASDPAARATDLTTIADHVPGSGPLGGLATALAWAAETGRSGETSRPPRARSLTSSDIERRHEAGSGPILLVAACDQPSLDADGLRALVSAVTRTDGGAAELAAARFLTRDGRRHPLPSAWRVAIAAGPVRQLYAEGERRIGAAFGVVATAEVATLGADLIDLDTPADLARWQEGQHRFSGA